MFDAHCHLHDARVLAEAAAYVARARAAGVTGALLAGVDPPGWDDERRLAAAFPELALSFGIHPQRVAELWVERGEAAAEAACEEMLAALEAGLAAGGVCCVGEIGLDAVGERRASLALQERVFVRQLEVARRARLPVALHVLKTHGRALEVVARAGLPSAGGMVHSFSGSAEVARDWVALGLSLSFAGPVGRAEAQKTRRAAAEVPDERLLVETDAPDQTPPAHRGAAVNEPAFLVANVEALAQIRGRTPDEVARLTERNARRLLFPASPSDPR